MATCGSVPPALLSTLSQAAAAAVLHAANRLPWHTSAELRHDLATLREADAFDRSAVSVHIEAKALKGAYGQRIRRRAALDHERRMPRQLHEDLQHALRIPHAQAQRAAVDKIVRGIADGTYGQNFRRWTQADAPR